MSQSGPESNVNEEVIHIPQISKTKAWPSDAVQYLNQDTPFW